jgi:hypothetical protein
MNTWIPLWASTVDSTLWEEEPDTRVMFLTLLMLRDPDQVVRLPLRVLAKKANLDGNREQAYLKAEEALKVLEEPDRHSLESQEHEGRRIKRVEDGWFVINGQKYDDEMRELYSRMRKTKKQRERREAARAAEEAAEAGGVSNFRMGRSKPLTGETASAMAGANGHDAGADQIEADILEKVGMGLPAAPVTSSAPPEEDLPGAQDEGSDEEPL